MTRILACLLALLPTLAEAETTIVTGTPAADAWIAKALVEQQVFLTCSSLTKSNHDVIVQSWQRDVLGAGLILLEKKVPQDVILAFVAASKVNALMPAPDAPFSDVKALCDAHPKWEDNYYQLNMVYLELKLPLAFAP